MPEFVAKRMRSKQVVISKIDNKSGPKYGHAKAAQSPLYRFLGTDLRIEKVFAKKLAEVVSKNVGRPNDEQADPNVGQAGLLERISRLGKARWAQVPQED